MENDDAYVRPEKTTGNSSGLPDDFLSEIDRELDSIESGSSTGMEEIELAEEEGIEGLSDDPGVREMQLLFIEMARNTLSPIGRYVKAMVVGDNFRELLEMSEMIVTPILLKTEKVGLTKHADDLMFFRSLLHLALGERDQVGMEAMGEVVMEGFSKLSERFGLSYRGYRLAVRNLVQFYRQLKHIDGISETDMRRFFAIGVPSLTWIRRTRVEELTSLSGIQPSIMSQIRKLAFVYRSVPPMASARLAREERVVPPAEEEMSEENLAIEEIVDADVAGVEVRAPRGRA
ncbi:MAG: hypothetical protein V1798_03640 [Pseudomonadota bacterium]